MDRELFTGFLIVIAAAALGGWVANPLLAAGLAGLVILFFGTAPNT